MASNTAFPPGREPENSITEHVLRHPRVAYHVDDDALVIVMKDELLVRPSVRDISTVANELDQVAELAGSLSSQSRVDLAAGAEDVEVWRITAPDTNSIDVAQSLRRHVADELAETVNGPAPVLTSVTPNHVCVVSSYDTCPASPPNPVPPPSDGNGFVPPPPSGPSAGVVVIDTGYIKSRPPHAELDQRVTVKQGKWFDSTASPPQWKNCPRDVKDANGDKILDGVAGHGTFIAGVVAHWAPRAEITVVGQRHDCMPLADPPDPVDRRRLFATELDVAAALLNHAATDVVSCGFAFPTLGGYASLPFIAAMQALTSPNAPRRGVAVVAPTGNERSTRACWPAAHPDVIGVASTNRRGTHRASFSNWGTWANCCTRGEAVTSTFIDWRGPIDGEPATDIEHFRGWARWDGTSFAAPKVSAAIASLVAENADSDLLPTDAWQQLVSGSAGVTVTPIRDTTLFPPPGVTLAFLHLG